MNANTGRSHFERRRLKELKQTDPVQYSKETELFEKLTEFLGFMSDGWSSQVAARKSFLSPDDIKFATNAFKEFGEAVEKINLKYKRRNWRRQRERSGDIAASETNTSNPESNHVSEQCRSASI